MAALIASVDIVCRRPFRWHSINLHLRQEYCQSVCKPH